MYETVASCKDISWATVTNWETQARELVGSCYAVKQECNFIWYLAIVSGLQRYGVTLSGNITSLCPDSDTLRRTVTGRDRNLAMYRSVEQGHEK